ncbi:hypothetical protein [Actinoplanes sp. HUAS TT8]|uniref:hypothetical protein n=1 Tax=Actinoplanes sp. HUAS TT8 TaxID=3447453 RepID=UPI003F5283EF
MGSTIGHRSIAHPRSEDYVLSPILEVRPDTGLADTVVECEYCGQKVQCRLYSVAETQRLRARWRRTATLCIAAIIVGLVVDVAAVAAMYGKGVTSELPGFLIALSVVAMTLCFLMFQRARRLAASDDGVRLTGSPGKHQLRWSPIMVSD